MKILKSFKCATKGLIYTVKNEKNMRIHTVASFYVLLFSCFFDLNIEKYLLLFLVIGLVITLEMINSSIEAIIDICAKEYNTVAKVAKDVAAGSVMVASLIAVVTGLALFCDMSAYVKMWEFFVSHKMALLVFVLSVILSCVYIRSGPTEIKNKIKFLIRIFKNIGK